MVNAPDGATQQDAIAYVADVLLPQEAASPPLEQTQAQNDSFLGNIQSDFMNRGQQVRESWDATMRGEQSPLSFGLQFAGKGVAGPALDVVGEAVSQGVGLVGRGIESVAPEAYKGVSEYLSSSPVVQAGLGALQKGVEYYEDWASQNPVESRNLESIVNIGSLALPVKSTPRGSEGVGVIGRLGESAQAAGRNQIRIKREDFIDDLIRPKQTSKVKLDQVSRTTEQGLLKAQKVALSPREESIKKAVIDLVPDVNSKQTLTKNYNLIGQAARKEADSLVDRLSKNDVVFPRKEFNAEMKRVRNILAENPDIVGDSAKTAERILDKMESIFSTKKSTASGLLEARKDLDKYIRSIKGDTAFDPVRENAFTTALREIRQSTNNFIDSRAKDVGVKESLKKQSNLLSALDNIGPKAAIEAPNRILRAWDRVRSIIPLRGEFSQAFATILGLGGLGAAAATAPVFTKLMMSGGAVYGGYKALTSPRAKQLIGELLKYTDDAIKAATDPNTIKQLRADKAYMIELLKETSDYEKETETEKSNDFGNLRYSPFNQTMKNYQ